MYGFDINNSKERFFTIGHENQRKKWSFTDRKNILNIVSSTASSGEYEDFIENNFCEANVNSKLSTKETNDLRKLVYEFRTNFAKEGEPLTAIKGHEVDIELNIEKPYPPLLKRPAYPASPKSREALEEHINTLVEMNVLRKVGHNEEVKITTPVIIAWHNGKSRMCGDFRALNSYTRADR